MGVKLPKAKYTGTRESPTPEEEFQFVVNAAGDVVWPDGRIYIWDGSKYVCEDGDGRHELSFLDGTKLAYGHRHVEDPEDPEEEPTLQSGRWIMTGPLDPEPE